MYIVDVAYGVGSWLGWDLGALCLSRKCTADMQTKLFRYLDGTTREQVQQLSGFRIRLSFWCKNVLRVFACQSACLALSLSLSLSLSRSLYFLLKSLPFGYVLLLLFSWCFHSHHVMHTCLCTWRRPFVLSLLALSFFVVVYYCCCCYCDATWPLFFCTHFCRRLLFLWAVRRCEHQSAFPFSI